METANSRIIEEIHNALEEREETSILIGEDEEREAYAPAILGLVDTDTGTRVAYSEEKLIECMMNYHNWSHEDALDWYGFNTVRGIQYIPLESNPPLIVEDSMVYYNYGEKT